ncbi:MAG: hypothetical protein RIR59_1489 [Pseudomonadota bacterium]|jgi:hypothetical protein
MANLFIVLVIGGMLGWGLVALPGPVRAGRATAAVLIGCAASFAGAMLANGGSLYTGLTATSYAASLAACLIALGLAGLAASWRRR